METKQKITRKTGVKNLLQSELLQNLKGKKKNFNFIDEWEKLGKEINEKWDSVSLEDELNYQRNKNS